MCHTHHPTMDLSLLITEVNIIQTKILAICRKDSIDPGNGHC